MGKTFVRCSKCGATAEIGEAISRGWLIASRKGKEPGGMVIRCPRHVTGYALRIAGERK